MFDENQIVQVKWNNTNRDWYESKGYVYTKRYEFFNVFAKDLSHRSDAKIKVVCDYCGEGYNTQYASIIKGREIISKDCCSHCTGKKTSDVSRKRRANKKILLAQQICKENGYELITAVDDYIDTKMDAHFICPKHGKQIMMLDNLLRGHKCRSCSYEERSESMRHDIQYVKEYIQNINNNVLLNPEEYKGAFVRNLNIQCICGKVFTTSFSNYSRAGVNKCFSCSCKESTGEQRIRKFLEFNDIEFEQEKRFDDCRDIKPLPFDFYLPQFNLIIEFDGKQHFEEMEFGNYKATKNHDEMKNQYCKSHGIDLLRIPYWEGNNIENIIADKLNL